MDQINNDLTWEPFRKELTKLINCHSIDNLTNTPDYILAEMICGFIIVHANETRMRDEWFGFNPEVKLNKEVTIDE